MMTYEIEEPVVTSKPGPGGESEDVETHPAFAQISVNRASWGGGVNLYGSDFSHGSVVTLAISTSELHRTLNRDWHFSRGQIIEVAMTEAQWATLVSSFGQGSGVPCTIQRRQGVGPVPGLPPRDTTDKFKVEFKEDLDDIDATLFELEEKLKRGFDGLSKKRAEELLRHVTTARRKVTSTLPFVGESFERHVEKNIEKAKTEVHGYLANQINRAGLTALGAVPNDVLKLEDDNAVS